MSTLQDANSTRRDSFITCAVAKPPRASFLTLPGEIRNTIYALVATDTSLQLHAHRKRHRKTTTASSSSSSSRSSKLDPSSYSSSSPSPRKPIFSPSPSSSSSTKPPTPTPPGLLLTSKRTRNEYLPILLSHAQISTHISHFDFQALQSKTDSLYSTERRALRKNRRLTLHIVVPALGLGLGACSSDNRGNRGGGGPAMLAGLRRWLVYQTGTGAGPGALPWTYGLAWPGEEEQRFKTREAVLENRVLSLRAAVDAVGLWLGSLDESLRWEAGPLMDLFERELERLPLAWGIARAVGV